MSTDPRNLPRNTEAVSARDVAAVPAAAEERPHRPADDREEVYYQGSPMVRGEIGMFLLWSVIGVVLILAPFLWHFVLGNEWWPWFVTAAAVVIGLLLILVPVLVVRQYRYRISNYRIDYEKGLLGKKIETLELWHVDDIEFQQSFFDRIMGVGQITVFSNDKTTPRLELKGLPNPRPLFESLKQRVIAVKRQRGVIKMDIG
jgi:uncharacterized membrane protein YdbT with pleckstrin-like domain